MLISSLVRALQNQSQFAHSIRLESAQPSALAVSTTLGQRASLARSQDVVGKYALATGEAASYRLGVLQRVYGPGTHRLLLDAGLQPGMHVADVGCGVGTVTALLAEIVGPNGSVVGIDASAAQLVEARQRLSSECAQVNFVEASATDTRMPSATFDVVYCRFLLVHLLDPVFALWEMRRLLKPNGILICEDGDLTSADSEPASALGSFAELFSKLGSARGLDYTLGRRLYQLVLDAGFRSPEVTFNQPVIARGTAKRLLELTVAEAAPALVAAGIISAIDVERLLLDMHQVAKDERVLAIMPRLTQIWARSN